MIRHLLFCGLSLVPAVAFAQAAPPPAAPIDGTAPLAKLKDEKQLAEAIAQITSDPSIPITDPKAKALAQALMTEGVRQLLEKQFDQALANFLEAYSRFPSPKILLNVAGTLSDMGRTADAANTYQRYLLDPATGPERAAEVKQILNTLDAELTLLTVKVNPRGSEISIDGGPFIAVGVSLMTRVRAGIHLVRIRKGDATAEQTVNGFEGENKEVNMVVAEPPPPALPPGPGPTPVPDPKAMPEPPDEVSPWLTNGTLYGGDATSNERTTRTTFGGNDVDAVIPDYELTETGQIRIKAPEKDVISSGLIAVMRIDGEGRGFAGGFGIAVSRGRLEAELMVLRSELNGGFIGLRYRLLTGFFRPYVAAGVPGFVFTPPMETSSQVGVGIRGAAGVELKINGHLSIQGDIGYEHFFVDEEETLFDANVLVPTLGVIGRL
ncbi:MAG: tol-pal system YbgF family protein [Kofleriaceae bacterium]